MTRAVVFCCALLLLASCGGDDADEAAPTSSAAAPDETTVTLGEAPSGEVVAITAEPCSLLTAEEVAAATGLAVTDAIPDSSTTCVFDLGAEAGVDIFITVDDGAGRMTSPSAVYADYAARVGDGSAVAIDGVGAGAFYDSGFRAIAVDAGGGRFFVVGVNGGYQALEQPRDALISLAENAVVRL